MDRLQKVISVLEIDLNSTENKFKEKQNKMEHLQLELSSIQTNHFEATLKVKKLSEENKSLNSLVEHYEKERKDFMAKYNSFNEDLQKVTHFSLYS